MEDRHLIVTIYERDKLLQALKELGFLWIEGEGILDRVLIALAPNSLVQTNKVYRLTSSESLQFCKWIRNMGLEDALFYKGVSHLGSRLDTEVYQTIYPQFNLESYIENSEKTINKFSLERVLKFFSKFTWNEIVFIALE